MTAAADSTPVQPEIPEDSAVPAGDDLSDASADAAASGQPSAADAVASVIAEAPDVEVPADAEAPAAADEASSADAPSHAIAADDDTTVDPDSAVGVPDEDPSVASADHDRADDDAATGEDPDIEVPSSAEAPAGAARAASEDAETATPSADEAATDETATDETATDEPSTVEAPTDETATDDTATDSAPSAAAPAPTPTPTPRPAPRPPMPRAPRPAAPAAPVTAPRPAGGSGEAWGRVEDDGTVSVRENGEWRVVGQYPDGTPAEALAYFERKFSDLASEVTLLEGRHRAGGASASDLRSTAEALRERIVGAAAVGDLARLEARVDVLTSELAADSETEAAAAKEAVQEAIRTRTELVERAEALAARDPRTIQWKQATAELATLFEEWQAHQQNGPRLPRSTGQQLWKRFRDARGIVDKHRREFYASLDEEHKGVRERKTRLVEKAEALAPKGEDGIGAYRELLDQWKTAGRAGKKVDDALWARFKAAGDALYSARGEREAADAEASREKIEAKKLLLAEARTVADESDSAKARTLLTGIQRRWDDIGRIFPRDKERALDDDLRKIEQTVRGREEVEWKRNNPETKARANDMTRQLMDAIEKLEQEVAAAAAAGDRKAEARAAEALEARKAWLKAVGG